ncbi:MAG: phosphate acyltransferase PlsX [Candidatus Zipacnadales bacterium]
MRIAVDAMGGDRAPEEVVRGALRSCEEGEHQIVLVGQPDAIGACLAVQSYPRARVEICPAEEVIGMGDPPVSALKRRNTSLAIAIQLLRNGEVGAVVSAGNSGAFMAYALVELEALDGVERPAIAICIPTLNGPRIILDAGANANCKPEHLVQFARMGREYARHVLRITDPKVGLLSIGVEATKGSDLTKSAHRLLDAIRDELTFIGNVESDTLFTGEADVVVCDGFSGNVLLKTAEGTAGAMLDYLREVLAKGWRGKLAALLLRGELSKFKAVFDYATYGGALLLGVKGICVVSHGRSDARAIKSAINVAKQGIEARVVDHIANSCRKVDVQPISPPIAHPTQSH